MGHMARMRYEKCVQNFGWKTWRGETIRKTQS